MLSEIKNTIEGHLVHFFEHSDEARTLRKISPLLFTEIRNFVLREGKRIRPALFVISYCGYAKKLTRNLYTTAIALELLHDFVLIHDDIIDDSDSRRGYPSMHTIFDDYLTRHKNVRCGGKEFAIVIGDMIYAMAIRALLSLREDMRRKEKAFALIAETAVYTGGGEFLELLYGPRDLECLRKTDICTMYDLKTARYTFCCPLTMGAILAGAPQNETRTLCECGIYLGRAFQIEDDIEDMFGQGGDRASPSPVDAREVKITFLLWHAYRNGSARTQRELKRILNKDCLGQRDLIKMREMMCASGTLEYARTEIYALTRKATKLIASLRMRPEHKHLLHSYSLELLRIGHATS